MTKGLLNTNRFTNKGKNTPSQEKAFLATSPKLGADKTEEVRHNNYMECRLLDFNEVCNLLNIGRSTLYCLINKKQIKAVKLASRTLFR